MHAQSILNGGRGGKLSMTILTPKTTIINDLPQHRALSKLNRGSTFPITGMDFICEVDFSRRCTLSRASVDMYPDTSLEMALARCRLARQWTENRYSHNPGTRVNQKSRHDKTFFPSGNSRTHSLSHPQQLQQVPVRAV